MAKRNLAKEAGITVEELVFSITSFGLHEECQCTGRISQERALAIPILRQSERKNENLENTYCS